MRLGSWCITAAALLVFANVCTAQVELEHKRRLPTHKSRSSVITPENESQRPQFRHRNYRRKEEVVSQDDTPTKSRSRPPERVDLSSSTEHTRVAEENSSRKIYSRTRSKPSIEVSSTESSRSSPRSRLHLSSRNTKTTTSTLAPSSSSPPNDVENTSNDHVSSSTLKDLSSSPFSRRSSFSPTATNVASNKYNIRSRNHVRTRSDLQSSSTTNSVQISNKPSTTGDYRSIRKNRYKQKLAEADPKPTQEPLASEVIKSSQDDESSASQTESKSQITSEKTVQHITEAIPGTSTVKVTKVVRRPLTRGKANFRPTVNFSKKKSTNDEISEDDNYPESFKALLQAKNALPQPSSTTEESLTVKATQAHNTYTSPQPHNVPSDTKYSRQRKMAAKEEALKDDNNDDNQSEINAVVVSPKSKTPEYKPRGQHIARTRKTFSSTTPVSTSSERTPHKYNRKLKFTTTEKSKQENSINTNDSRKSLRKRPLYYSRNSTNSNQVSSSSESYVPLHSGRVKSLPRTSYYSKSRSKANSDASTTTPINDVNITAENHKSTESIDNSLKFITLLKKPDENDKKDNGTEMYIIAVKGKDSKQNKKEVDIETSEPENVSDRTETEIKEIITSSPSSKYHASYKSITPVNAEEEILESTPGLKNVPSNRRRVRPNQSEPSNDVPVKANTRDSRKFSEISKTSEAPLNFISLEPEKPKNRFSSKYRASYLDKQFYKPTVPTVTSSTAWLKFFVTDRWLTKSVEEPNWFNGNKFFDVTTEPMSRMNIYTSPFVVEPQLDLEEGEEMLGPDTNAISFTKTRSKLTSADLRLSNLMNVEASNHSPSVTVSIFDALAEILTSTPKPRISSTTELLDKKVNNNVKETLNDVSNNVNNVKSLASDNTASKDYDVKTTTTKNVNSFNIKTSNVFNSSIDQNVATSIKAEESVVYNTSTLSVTSHSNPTTPISARRPFAIKILYSGTESTTTDQATTTMESPTKTLLSENNTMVYNTVSDLLLTNNNVVSSELTSMLSNNIDSIMKNMNDTLKSKVSLDMAKILRSLIPRALNSKSINSDDVDISDNTTPYSLEEIRDTEDVNIDVADRPLNFIQTVSKISSQTKQVGEISTSSLDDGSLSFENSSLAELGDRTTSSKNITDVNLVNTESPFITTTHDLQPSDSTPMVSKDSEDSTPSSLNSTQIVVPVPFISNFELDDFQIGSGSKNITNSMENLLKIPFNTKITATNDFQRITDVSPTQLWILSKKAKVLQMIEDLIRQSNDEIATAPTLTEVLDPQNNVLMSDRLTEILNTMSLTTTDTTFTSTLQPVSLGRTVSEEAKVTTEKNENLVSQTLPTTTDLTTVISPTTETDMQDNISTQVIEDFTTIKSNIDTRVETTTSLSIEKSSSTQQIKEKTEEKETMFSQVVTRPTVPKKDFVIFGILPNNTVVRKDPNDDILENLTEASPYIVYGLLPNNTVIRKFPNGTRVPRVMQKIDILPISPSSLRNPYSPIHNNPAIVRPQYNPIQISINDNTVTSTTKTNNDSGLTSTVYNLQMIPSRALDISNCSSLGITTNKPVAISTASHVSNLRTTTMLPSVEEILLNSISSAAKEDLVISSMTTPSHETRILTLDIDPETKQVRTEGDGKNFKFVPIETVTVESENTNVLKLASKKPPANADVLKPLTTSTEVNTQAPQLQTASINDPTTTERVTVGTFMEKTTTPSENFVMTSTTSYVPMTSSQQSSSTLSLETTATTELTTVKTQTITQPDTTIEINNQPATNTPVQTTSTESFTMSTPKATTIEEDRNKYQKDLELIQGLLNDSERGPKAYNSQEFNKGNQNKISLKSNQVKTTTQRSIEDDIRQFEEDTKLLKALLQATGQNPADFNIPTLDIDTIKNSLKSTPETFTTSTTTSTSSYSTTVFTSKYEEDVKILEDLLRNVENGTNSYMPVIINGNSNVRVSPGLATVTTPTIATTTEPIGDTQTTTRRIELTTSAPSVLTTLQKMNEIPTTSRPYRPRGTFPTTSRSPESTTGPTARRVPASSVTFTTEIPSTSTFSVEEDLAFLQNLKSVLNTNGNNEDPEAILANRVIALAVEKSLKEIQSGANRGGKAIFVGGSNQIPTTEKMTTTTTTTTTTTARPTTVSTPSLEQEIKQFEEDTKLLKALLQATGQDPSQFNIPTLPPIPTIKTSTDKIRVSPALPPISTSDLNVLTNLLSTPSPLNEDFDPLTEKMETTTYFNIQTSPKPYGSKIAVKENLKNEQDDAKLLKTLVKIQNVQGPSTQKNKLTFSEQSSDEAIKTLIQQQSSGGMMSSATTKSAMSISTEFGRSNDALLAALLKEQGFGPTTASSLDEQVRLSALLNQVVVTPKFRTTTQPPPPPLPRRPVLDGLAWLWQQWRESAPGPKPSGSSGSKQPVPATSSATRVNWFGSGPFVGNADDVDSAPNRVPLEPPRAVASIQAPARGQLVSAAINVTRAFSQFLGAAIQGAAQTVQNVIRAGQRATYAGSG